MTPKAGPPQNRPWGRKARLRGLTLSSRRPTLGHLNGLLHQPYRVTRLFLLWRGPVRTKDAMDMGGHLQQPRVVAHDVADYDNERSTNFKYSSTAAITMNDRRVHGHGSS